jgi:hypothetical protein
VGCQQELAAGIPGSQLVIIDGAGYNPPGRTGRRGHRCPAEFPPARQRLLEMAGTKGGACDMDG